jgi:thioredoxin 2
MKEAPMTTITVPCQFCDALNRIDAAKLDLGPKCAECARPFLLDRPIKVNEARFDAAVLKSGIPVLVDFHADWCGPCHMMAPHLDAIAHERKGRLLVVKVDTDHSPTIAARYNIRSIPFFGLFEHGQLAKTAVGAVGRAGLEELVAPPRTG